MLPGGGWEPGRAVGPALNCPLRGAARVNGRQPVIVGAVDMPEMPEDAGFWHADILFPSFHCNPRIPYEPGRLFQSQAGSDAGSAEPGPKRRSGFAAFNNPFHASFNILGFPVGHWGFSVENLPNILPRDTHLHCDIRDCHTPRPHDIPDAAAGRLRPGLFNRGEAKYLSARSHPDPYYFVLKANSRQLRRAAVTGG